MGGGGGSGGGESGDSDGGGESGGVRQQRPRGDYCRGKRNKNSCVGTLRGGGAAVATAALL